jgi:translation initiation factor 3 subunit F
MTSVTLQDDKERRRLNPPKSFNIASRVMMSSSEQLLSCRVHPVAILTILDSYVRRPEGARRTIGTLLGYITGSVLDITDAYAVIHKDTDDQGVLMETDYHKHVFQLRQKVSPREVVVGWFSTGDEITGTSAVIHSFYCSKESHFQPSIVLPSPIHLLVDTSLQKRNLEIKAFLNVRTVIADSLLQFHEIPLEVQTSAAEKAGISLLMQARRAAREAPPGSQPVASIGQMDGFEGGLRELLELFKKFQAYVREVHAGKKEGDLTVGRSITRTLCMEPVIDVDAVENLCMNSLQDTLMVVYLSNLTKTQISLAEKINAACAGLDM